MVASGSKPRFDYGLWQSCIKKKRAAAGIPDKDHTPEDMKIKLEIPDFGPGLKSQKPLAGKEFQRNMLWVH
jgi:hypothetical protein